MAGLDQLLGLLGKATKQQDVDSDGERNDDLGSYSDSDEYEEEEVSAGMVEARALRRTQLLFSCVFYVGMLMGIPSYHLQDDMDSSDDEGPPEGKGHAHKPEPLPYLRLVELGDEAAPDAQLIKAFVSSLQQVRADLQ
jgi:hypothetical protein